MRAYVDVPYVVLVLAALAIETRRRRAGWPVIARARPRRPAAAGGVALRRRLLALPVARLERRASARGSPALVALAPALWALSDLLVTGDPLWSLTHTRSTAVALNRPTGLLNVPYYGARRLGEVLAPDGLVAGALGGVLALWLTRSRALLGAAAGVLAVVALALVAAAGLPIQDRYVFLIAALAAVFGGAGLFGWRTLEPGHPRRRLWQGAAVVIVVAIGASIPWQVPRFHKTFDSTVPADQSLAAQQRIADDLSRWSRATR